MEKLQWVYGIPFAILAVTAILSFPIELGAYAIALLTLARIILGFSFFYKAASIFEEHFKESRELRRIILSRTEDPLNSIVTKIHVELLYFERFNKLALSFLAAVPILAPFALLELSQRAYKHIVGEGIFLSVARASGSLEVPREALELFMMEERHHSAYLLFSILSIEAFAFVWFYILARDFNAHMKLQEEIIGDVLASQRNPESNQASFDERAEIC